MSRASVVYVEVASVIHALTSEIFGSLNIKVPYQFISI